MACSSRRAHEGRMARSEGFLSGWQRASTKARAIFAGVVDGCVSSYPFQAAFRCVVACVIQSRAVRTTCFGESMRSATWNGLFALSAALVALGCGGGTSSFPPNDGGPGGASSAGSGGSTASGGSATGGVTAGGATAAGAGGAGGAPPCVSDKDCTPLGLLCDTRAGV